MFKYFVVCLQDTNLINRIREVMALSHAILIAGVDNKNEVRCCFVPKSMYRSVQRTTPTGIHEFPTTQLQQFLSNPENWF